MGGGLVEVLKHHIFLQIDIYQYLTKKFCLRVEDGGTKRKKISETVNSNLKVDHSLSLKSSRDEYMSKIIRIFGVEAVWKQTILPPHLSNIYQSDGYKAVFLSVEGGGKNKKKYTFFRSASALPNPLPSCVVNGMSVLPLKVIIAEEGEHHRGYVPHHTGPPIYICVVLGDMINFAFISRKFIILSFLGGKFDEVIIWHVVILIGYDFKLSAPVSSLDGISHSFGIADLDISYAIIIARMREKYNERFSVLLFILLLFEIVLILCLTSA
jgi:hypothetical protein